MAAQEIIGPSFVLLRLLSGPSAGEHYAIALGAGEHNASDSRHWLIVYSGSDAEAFKAACALAGVEAPTA
jgi:hypothetical protein